MQELTIALGSRFYRVQRPWGRLPENIKLDSVSQLAVDTQGCVYVFQRSDPPVVVFDPSGEYLRSWGSGQISDAHGIYITADDRVYLVDRDAHEILIFSTKGTLIASIGNRHRPQHGGPFNHPTDVALSRDGEIYVSDGYGNSMVHRFSAEGELIQSWGGPGRDPGQFSTPHGIWVDRENRVLVADRENDRVQLFTRSGQFLAEWGDLDHPMDIYEDAQGMIYVTDCIPRLNMFAHDGTLVGRCRPTFNAPHGVWGNLTGDLYLAEQTPDRVTKLCALAECQLSD